MDKEDTAHTHTHIYIWNITQPNEWNNVICSNLDGPTDCHAEWSKSNTEREMSYNIPYMWNLIWNDTNELIYKTENDW